ncbi:MAG: bacterial Ig-like domain-containing protein [Clostridia bacterium]|nr:bacterial Ig-like domain-containing protein [Clostridia bacterium]
MKNKLFSIMLVVFMVAMSLVTLVGCTVTYVSIRIDSEAMKTDYVKGEALSYEGLKVYATTDKGEEVELTAEQYTLSVEAGTKVEKKTTITVALVDQPEISEKFNVKCHNEIVSAEIKTHATKLEYLVGERFDATGLVVTVTRENGEKKTLPTVSHTKLNL